MPDVLVPPMPRGLPRRARTNAALIDNGKKGRAKAVRPIEDALIHLCCARRMPGAGSMRPFLVPSTETHVWRFALWVEPWTTHVDARVIHRAVGSSSTTACTLQLYSDYDPVGQTENVDEIPAGLVADPRTGYGSDLLRCAVGDGDGTAHEVEVFLEAVHPSGAANIMFAIYGIMLEPVDRASVEVVP